MPRKNLNKLKSKSFTEIIHEYADNKIELDSIKKICDEQNKAIKAAMTEMESVSDGKWEYEDDTVKAIVNTTCKQTLDEDMLLDVFTAQQSLGKELPEGLIKTKSYVDLDVLEDAMYKQLIGPELMMEIDNCRIVKKTQVLTVKKKEV